MNFRFPVFLDLAGKRCLVIGEGYEVPAKVHMLVDAGAEVLYLNSAADPRIEALADAGVIRWERRAFVPADLDNCFLVISDQENNAEIFRLCEQARVLCNSVDDPEHCRFSFGSIHRQGDLTIAISTNGWAPAVAVRLKEKMQREIGPEYAALLSMLKEVRPKITQRIAEFSQRRELWYRIVDSDILGLLKAGKQSQASESLRHLIDSAISNTSRSDTSAGDADR
jgi:precorrin-2 dehydrogenase / sirohydrochlorin ferrochelatase